MNKIQEYLNSLTEQTSNKDYIKIAEQAISYLNSYEQDSYTDLPNQISTVLQLTQEIKGHLSDIDLDIKDNFVAISNSENLLYIRVEDTLRVILILSMIPANPAAEKYKNIILSSRSKCLTMLQESIVPELINVLKGFKKTTEKIKQIKTAEEVYITTSDNLKVIYMLYSWSRRYDSKFEYLRNLMFTP
jgi:hypothetical protein